MEKCMNGKNKFNKNYDRFEKYSVVLTGAQFEPPLRNNIRAQGSQHAERYYMSLTTLINRRWGIGNGERDYIDKKTLMRLKSLKTNVKPLKTIVELHIGTLMKKGLPYKEVYQGVRQFVEAL